MCKGAPVELPPPLKDYHLCLANVISSDDDGDDFKVVLAEGLVHCVVDGTARLSIQTFCSWTGKWELSHLTCSTHLDLFTFVEVEGGSVIRGGRVIYWKTKDRIPRPGLAEWVIDGDCITRIPDSPGSFKVYCESPQPLGLLMSASFGQESEDLGCGRGRTMLVQSTIGLYALDDDKKEWDCLYSVTLASIWTKYFGPTEAKPWQDFILVSFVPGKSDSVFLGFERQLFAYHFPTCKLELVECIEHDHAFEIPVCYYPLTERDLGIWPCSPTPLHSS